MIDFAKDFRNFKKTSRRAQSAISLYEHGYITFGECLYLLNKAHNDDIIEEVENEK